MFEEHSPENNDKFGKRIGLSKKNTRKSQMGRDQVSGGVSIPCQRATPVKNVMKSTYDVENILFSAESLKDANVTGNGWC